MATVRSQISEFEIEHFFHSLQALLGNSLHDNNISFDTAEFLYRRLDGYERNISVLLARLKKSFPGEEQLLGSTRCKASSTRRRWICNPRWRNAPCTRRYPILGVTCRISRTIWCRALSLMFENDCWLLGIWNERLRRRKVLSEMPRYLAIWDQEKPTWKCRVSSNSWDTSSVGLPTPFLFIVTDVSACTFVCWSSAKSDWNDSVAQSQRSLCWRTISWRFPKSSSNCSWQGKDWSCCFRTIRCIAFVFHFKDVCFGVYYVHFKFIPELFILFLWVSILIRALRLSFVDLEHIASVFECKCLTSYNFDRNGAP